MARAGWHYRHPMKGGRHVEIGMGGAIHNAAPGMDDAALDASSQVLATGELEHDPLVNRDIRADRNHHRNMGDKEARSTFVIVDGPACMWLSFLPWGTGKERMETDYLRRFFGGRIASRITIPMIDADGILKAADALHELAHALRKVATSRDKKLTKLLSARSAIYHAHASLRIEGVRTDGRPCEGEILRKRLGATSLRKTDK